MHTQAPNGSAEMAAARNQPTWPPEHWAPPQTIIIQANDNQQPLALIQAARLQAHEQHQHDKQSFADWWNEYWSRQPFPSGYTQSSIFLLACLLTTIVFLIVVGNLLVCIAIFTEKSLKPTQNWFIASLAVSDMLLGLVVMPVSLSRELMGFWVFGPLWCDIHEALDVLLTTASINTLCLISLDRYWSITQAVSYLKKRTPRRGAFMIAFVWIFSAAVSLPPLIGWKKPQSPAAKLDPAAPPTSPAGADYDWLPVGEQAPSSAGQQPQQASAEYPSCRLSDDVGYVVYSALGSFYIPCAVMVFTYIKIFLAARSRARRAINKQSGRAPGSQAPAAAPSAGQAKGRQLAARRAQLDADSLKPLGLSLAPSLADSTSALQSTAGLSELPVPGQPPPAQIKPGKIVIVERKKSIASAPKPLASAEQPAGACTLTTSQAKQASASALSQQSGELDVSQDSSMITVMSSTMAELPVTRFNFQRAQPARAGQTGTLLKAIGQVGSDAEAERLLASAPDILEPATKETCFMTIEEDSDMFEAQSGRTIVMMAGNASSRQLAAGAHKQLTMTMLPASQQVAVCANATCRRQHAPARSASSYCGSSLTINEDELDDDELLTDDCNGYSASCALDQYCTSAGSTCAQCHECHCDCDQAHAESGSDSGSSAHSNLNSAPNSNQDDSLRCARPRAELQPDAHSSLADDNLSLTEYRSNDDDSSIVGHDMLDASDEPKHGPRKKSIINFRLARLGSSPFGGGAGAQQQPAGLLALAQLQHQRLAAADQPAAPRNLKTLRQNFFLKLNQLTAKSSAQAREPPAAKTSAPNQTSGSHSNGSGTSFEPSADCATTSNLHSNDYGQVDNVTSAPTLDGLPGSSSSDKGCELQPANIQHNRTTTNTTTNVNNQQPRSDLLEPTGAQQAVRTSCNDTALLLLDQQHSKDLKHEPSGLNSSSNKSTNKFHRFDDHQGKAKQAQQTQAHQYQLQVHQRPRKSAQLNRSSTLMSSSQAGSNQTNRAYLASDNERHKRKLAKARERRATLILGLIMAAFICSWLPFFTFYVIRAVCIVCRDYIPPRIESFIVWMGYCNSAINPIIYTIFNRDFRRAFRKILFRCL